MFLFGAFLTLKRRRPARLVLSPSLSYRVTFALLLAAAALILLSGVLFNGEATVFLGINTVPLLFVLATGLALLYNDCWVFDLEKGVVESRFGLLFLFRRRTLPIADLASIQISSFTKGRVIDEPGAETAPARVEARRRFFMPRMLTLTAVDVHGNARVLDTSRAGRLSRLERTGRRIADFCGIPFRGGSE